jgi:hypothetical protein
MINNQYWGHCLFQLAAAGLSVFGLAATAAPLEPNWLEVHLVDKQAGKPVANAAVCLGTSARTDQFGAIRTDSSGVARFDDIRPNALVLTVSTPGYQGRQQVLEPMYESRVLEVRLVTGGGGPVCDAPQAVAETDMGSGLSVGEVTVRAASGSPQAADVLVSVNTSGEANQIRISEQADFRNAEWEPYKPVLSFTLSPGAGLKQLYVQVRRATQVQGASIEVMSPAKRVIYNAR